MSRRPMRVSLWLLLLLALPGCQGCPNTGTTSPPTIALTFTSGWPQIARQNHQAIVQELIAGTRTLDDVQLQVRGCDFVADYSGSGIIRPRATLNGVPSSFNLTYGSSPLVNDTNAGNCVAG